MAYPFTQTAEPALAVGLIAANYRHHHHIHGQRTNYPITVPATSDGTARVWRRAFCIPRYPEYNSFIVHGKDIAFCLALLLMGFTPVYQMGKLKPGY